MFLNVRHNMKLKSMLKNCLDILIPPITDVINISIETSTFLQILRSSCKTTTLPKTELKNDRPVSNLSFIYKIIYIII